MPANIVQPGEEAAWSRAKAAVRAQYPDIDDESPRFYKLTTTIFQNMKALDASCSATLAKARPLLLVLSKAYVKAHQRKLPSGRTVTVGPYFTKHMPKGDEPSTRTRAPKHAPPAGVHTGLSPEQLAQRLVRHVQEGTMTHEEAEANVAHLERRAHRGHGLAHGHGPAWHSGQVHEFVGHARTKLRTHQTEQARKVAEEERLQQEEMRQHQQTQAKRATEEVYGEQKPAEQKPPPGDHRPPQGITTQERQQAWDEKMRQRQAEERAKTPKEDAQTDKHLDVIERDLKIEERKTAQVERDTERAKDVTDDEDEQIENVLHISGDTYPIRRELRTLGAVWNAEEKAYLIHPGKTEAIGAMEAKAERYKGQHRLTLTRKTAPASAFEELTGEGLRAHRQQQLDRKIALWRGQADRIDTQIQGIDARLKPYDDYAFWTEPIKVGHHSEQRHRNLRNRLSALMDKKMGLWREAKTLRDRADRVEQSGARIKGDTETRRQQERETREQAGVTRGSRIQNAIYGHGTVLKVNKNTYTVLFDQGHTTTTDKAHVTPLGETVDPATLKEQTTPKFKKGQRVTYNHIGQDRTGTITAVGPNRYTVKNDQGFSVQVDHARVRTLEDSEQAKPSQTQWQAQERTLRQRTRGRFEQENERRGRVVGKSRVCVVGLAKAVPDRILICVGMSSREPYPGDPPEGAVT